LPPHRLFLTATFSTTSNRPSVPRHTWVPPSQRGGTRRNSPPEWSKVAIPSGVASAYAQSSRNSRPVASLREEFHYDLRVQRSVDRRTQRLFGAGFMRPTSVGRFGCLTFGILANTAPDSRNDLYTACARQYAWAELKECFMNDIKHKLFADRTPDQLPVRRYAAQSAQSGPLRSRRSGK
jgi:hypothetical protein